MVLIDVVWAFFHNIVSEINALAALVLAEGSESDDKDDDDKGFPGLNEQ